MRSAIALSAVALVLVASVTAGVALAHCEIPCGIYGDKTRIAILDEHIRTIEKSIQQIQLLAGKQDATATNQLVRWIANKDDHATKVQHIVTQYFMTQRVKPAKAGKNYVPQLTALHGMLIEAMKCKQTVDAGHCAKLRSHLHDFAAAYFSPEDLEHLRKHHEGESK